MQPVDLWVQITQLPRPSRTVPFPRKDPATGASFGEVAIWVLTQEEMMLCASSAEKTARLFLKEHGKEQNSRGYEDVYNNASAQELLFRACRQVAELNKPFFPTPEAIRRTLSLDEVGVLMDHYFTVQHELGPIIASMSSTEMDAWIKRLGEGGSKVPLDLLTREQLKDLTFSLACRLYKSPTDTTSPGSLPDEPTASEPVTEDAT